MRSLSITTTPGQMLKYQVNATKRLLQHASCSAHFFHAIQARSAGVTPHFAPGSATDLVPLIKGFTELLIGEATDSLKDVVRL